MKKIKDFFEDWTLFEELWLILSTLIMLVLSIKGKDSPIALISGLAGIISVVLCAKGKLINYAFGMIQAITYCYICFKAQIYGEVMYNLLMIPMIIIGVISWKKNMSEDNTEVKARNLSSKGWLILIIICILSVAVYCGVLKMLGGNFALIDATSTVLSLIATVLMIARFSEQWLVWIFVNIASVALWVMALINGNPGSTTILVMWSAYLLNSVYGYINWRRMSKEN